MKNPGVHESSRIADSQIISPLLKYSHLTLFVGVLTHNMAFTNAHYESLQSIFQRQRFSLAFVDSDAFDTDMDYATCLAQDSGKTLRIGTKSMHCHYSSSEGLGVRVNCHR